jgi:phospholipid/cholesterol/gamma-HCH transport system substrate-binding protein
MRRVVAVLLLIAAATAVVVIALGSGDDGNDYEVRAIFDNAGFVIPGEDVKVAGVKVGRIDSLDVTDDFKAAVVLKITDTGYQDFRQDAECTVRPQSLIGERFVECELTQPRATGDEEPPALAKIDDGPGKGQYLLPVDHTSKAVDLDLINNILREPERQRLSIILDDLGIGVAGRGKDLAEVIRRADPALKETDKVLKILGDQNDVLQRLAVDSDTILAPLARERKHVSGAIENSGAVARATAERGDALRADLQRLPAFLRELQPTMVRLGSLSDEMTPVLTDLGAVAPDINRMILQLGPFSRAGIPALESLGDAADRGTPAVKAARPVVADLRQLATAARPVGANLRKLLESFQSTGGIERAMDYVFYQVAAINGFDSFGHYLRAGLIVNQCSNYSVTPVFGCSANFTQASATSATAAAASSGDPRLERTARVLSGEPATAAKPHKAKKHKHKHQRRKHHRQHRKQAEDPPASARPEATATPQATPAPAATPAPQKPSKTDALLDYLFGSGQ